MPPILRFLLRRILAILLTLIIVTAALYAIYSVLLVSGLLLILDILRAIFEPRIREGVTS